MITLIVATAVALLGHRFARALVPDGMVHSVGHLVAWVAVPVVYGLIVAFGSPEIRVALLALSLAVGFVFFVVERRRASASDREAARKAREQAMRQQRKRLPPPAPPGTTGTRTTP